MKLYGFSVSNYYNVAKLGLLEKGIGFEEVMTRPSQEEAYLEISPMGKVPALVCDDGRAIAESRSILVYLEKIKPSPALFPNDAFAAARTHQIHDFINLYLDVPARSLLMAAFFGAEYQPEQVREVSEKLDRGIKALGRVTAFDPFIAGRTLTHADLAAFNTLQLVSEIMLALKAPDPLTNLDGYSDWRLLVSQRPHFRKVMADREQALQQLFATSK